jgi:hypothetical protein
MSSNRNPKTDPGQFLIYEIMAESRPGFQYRASFAGPVPHGGYNGETVVTGPVLDHAALHGMTREVRDRGMPFVSGKCVEPARQPLERSNIE